MNPVRKKFTYGDQEVIIETGRIARQASASVLVSVGETSVLVAVVGRKEANPHQSFFPLTVNYEEKPMRRVRSPEDSSSVKVALLRKKR